MKMNAANQARLNKILEKKYRTREGIKTNREIIERSLEEGQQFFIHVENDENKRKKVLKEMQIISKNYLIAESWERQQAGRGSNHNLPAVKKYWVLFDELMDNCLKNIYMIGIVGREGYQVPKMIYDHYTNN